MSGAGGMRIGHAEREAVVAILRDAAAEGRIDLDELEERIEAALAAKTFGDLDPLVADLPVEPPSRAGRAGTALAPRAATLPDGVPHAPGMSEQDPLRLDGGWSTVRREGAWELPPFLRIDGGLGSVILNCLEARPLAEVIMIESLPGAGSIKVIVPEGWAANLDRLSSSWGSAKSKIPTTPAPGSPLLFFHGGLGMGSLVVRTPNWFDRHTGAA
ncbi:DUF1707 SHOCT-like domain-containing protein [Naumannella huperziae]